MTEFRVLLVKEGVVDEGASGMKKQFTASALQDAVDSLTGSVVCDGPEDNPNSIIGKVTDASYESGDGLYCTVNISDEEFAEYVEKGIATVVPRVFHEKINVETVVEPYNIEELQIDAVTSACHSTDHVGDITKV